MWFNLYSWRCIWIIYACTFTQVPLLLVWMLGLFITPSLRWQIDGFLMICWSSLRPSRISSKIPPLCNLIIEFWYAIIAKKCWHFIGFILIKHNISKFYNSFRLMCNEMLICTPQDVFFFSQGITSLTAITGLYLFSRRMMLPKRAKIAISLLAAMAYTQVG